jgi:glutaredoxin 3
MNILVYTTTTCPYCKMLKEYLNEKNVPYEEKRVDQDDAARDQMVQASGGFMGVPFSVVTLDNGEKENVVGFDKGKLDELLK